MREELERKLFNRYHKIFRQKDLPMNQTAMCWGISVSDKWFWLLDMLCGKIQSYIDYNDHLNIPQVEAIQVKEKYGYLCFYITGGDGRIRGMIALAEYMSRYICEECGSIEKVTQTKKGWIQTLCKKCYKKRK